MTITETALAIITSIITILASAAAGVRWLVKHYFEEIKHELKPNSGSSIKDQVNRMEKDITLLSEQNRQGEDYHQRLDNKLDFLTESFINYISKEHQK